MRFWWQWRIIRDSIKILSIMMIATSFYRHYFTAEVKLIFQKGLELSWIVRHIKRSANEMNVFTNPLRQDDVYVSVMCESGHLESESGSESRHLESESSWIRIHPFYFLALNPNPNPNPAQKALNPDSNPNPDSDSHITATFHEFISWNFPR